MNRSVTTFIPLALALAAAFADAQGIPNGTRRSPELLQAFRPVVHSASRSTARVRGDGKELALATVVSPDGLLVTKYSELKGKLTCELPDGRKLDATLIGVEPKHDLAMLKVQATGLTAVEWADSKKAEAGDWLASAGPGDAVVAIGVVGVPTRRPKPRDFPQNPPPPDSGFMGVSLQDGEGPATISGLEKAAPAEKAGLKKGDVILSVSGRKVTDAQALIETVQKFKAGETVTLKVKRSGPNGREEELELELAKRPVLPGGLDRGDYQNKMGSTLSVRRQGFPVILQHDMVIRPADCGGPVVNLDGKVIGVNIARAGRTESYAIPAEAVMALLPDLRSGKLVPKAEEVSAEEKRHERRRAVEKQLSLAKAEVRVLEGRLDTLRLIDDDSEKTAKMEKQLVAAKKKVTDLESELSKLKASK
jgi:serine protease Do